MIFKTKHQVPDLRSQFVNTLFCYVVIVAAGVNVDCSAQSVDDAQVREAVQKSLTYVAAKGQAWIESKQCVSCHQIPAMMWTLNRASENGFDLDDEKLGQWNEWSQAWINLVDPKFQANAKESETLLNENDAIAGLLLGRPAENQSSEWVTKYRSHLIDSQQEDGSWTPRGQLPTQKRENRETTEVSTAWALIASAGYKSKKADHAHVEKALKFLNDSKRQAKGESTEWWVTRLMVLRQFGDTAAADEARAQLIELQNKDGGWGWIHEEQSDALATGMVIFGLSKDGLGNQNAVVTRALSFLIDTQKDNGSWRVNCTKEAKRKRALPTSNYWGTCWAAIGMMETLNSGSLEEAKKTE